MKNNTILLEQLRQPYAKLTSSAQEVSKTLLPARLLCRNFLLVAVCSFFSFTAFGQYDISVDHSVDNPTPTLGSTVTFTITVSNLAGDTAKNVVLTDSLSACLRSVSYTHLTLPTTPYV